MKGIRIGIGYVLGKDGKISEDLKAKQHKMSVSQRIAAKANSAKKVRYGKGLLETRPKKGGD